MKSLLRVAPLSVLVVLVVALFAACGSNERADFDSALQQQNPVDSQQLATTDELDGFPRIPSLAESSKLFKPWQYGSDFAADLGSNRLSGKRHTVLFEPAAGTNLAEMAWGVYRLRCFNESLQTQLTFEWQGAAPAAGTCWIGLSDRNQNSWFWLPLPETNTVQINAAALADTQHQAYVAVVASGDAAVCLSRIVLDCDPDATTPYTLFNPLESRWSYLVDMEGEVAHEWQSQYKPGASIYLLDDNTLLRTARVTEIGPAGTSGRIEQLDWDGNVIWSFEDFPENFHPHHDIQPMPNGNILAIGWETFKSDEAYDMGRDPGIHGEDEFWLDGVIEIQPTEPEGGEIVWYWNLKDHLIQDFDMDKGNYGPVADHPELVDINYANSIISDYTHANAVSYSAELDQIVISMHGLNELMVIDHSTTTEEAASHSGGDSGMGGDILYRWGNPSVYRAGVGEDQQYFGQHDTQWIPTWYEGGGNLLVFNNGGSRPGMPKYSDILEITPPLNAQGIYDAGTPAFAPDLPAWSYIADPPESMYSAAMASAQRLPDGNTLICEAMKGHFSEVTPGGEIVWAYTVNVPREFFKATFRAKRYYLFEPDGTINPND